MHFYSVVDILTIQPFTNLVVPLVSASGQHSTKLWRLQDFILQPYLSLILFVLNHHEIKQSLCEKNALQLPYVESELMKFWDNESFLFFSNSQSITQWGTLISLISVKLCLLLVFCIYVLAFSKKSHTPRLLILQHLHPIHVYSNLHGH